MPLSTPPAASVPRPALRRSLRSASSGIAWAAAVCALVLHAGDAAACSGIYAANQLVLLTRQVPANGQIVVSFGCRIHSSSGFADEPCTLPASIAIVDDAGQLVPGEQTRSESAESHAARYFFKPIPALPVGASYKAGLDAQHASQQLTIVAPLTPDATVSSAEPLLRQTLKPSRHVCCEEVRDSCGEPMCVTLEGEYGANLSFALAFPANQYGQWRSRVHTWRADGTEVVSPWGDSEVTTFEQQEEYCIQAEISSLVDPSTVLLEKRCLPHGDLGDFGPHVEEVASLAELVAQCSEPPAGAEEAWCAGTAERCSIFPDDCERHERYCPAPSAPDHVDVVSADTSGGGAGCGLAPRLPQRSQAGACWGVLASSWLVLRRVRSRRA